MLQASGAMLISHRGKRRKTVLLYLQISPAELPEVSPNGKRIHYRRYLRVLLSA
jgi:hypothetical protein